MKRADIKIGTEYAECRGDYEYENGSCVRVRVTGLAKITQGWGYSRKTVTGVAIEYLNPDGTVRATGAVATRRIREEWATYNARWVEIRRQRKEARLDALEALDARAQRLQVIIPTLRRVAGIEDTKTFVYNTEVTNALERHVPEIFVLNEEGGRTSQISCPLASSISDYVQHGSTFKVSADDLLRLASRR